MLSHVQAEPDLTMCQAYERERVGGRSTVNRPRWRDGSKRMISGLTHGDAETCTMARDDDNDALSSMREPQSDPAAQQRHCGDVVARYLGAIRKSDLRDAVSTITAADRQYPFTVDEQQRPRRVSARLSCDQRAVAHHHEDQVVPVAHFG